MQTSPLIGLRKSAAHIHVTYGLTFSNNLFGTQWMAREGPPVEIHINLDKNLRHRIRNNSVLDATELIESGMDLKLLQVSDEMVLDQLLRVTEWDGKESPEWLLIITLQGAWRFRARPGVSGNALSLDVVGRA